MICMKCGVDNVQVVAETQIKNRGCMMILIHIILTCFTGGLWLLYLILKGRKVNSKTKFVCMTCGKQWY